MSANLGVDSNGLSTDGVKLSEAAGDVKDNAAASLEREQARAKTELMLMYAKMYADAIDPSITVRKHWFTSATIASPQSTFKYNLPPDLPLPDCLKDEQRAIFHLMDTSAITTPKLAISLSPVLSEEFDVKSGQEVLCSNPHARRVGQIEIANASRFSVHLGSVGFRLTSKTLEHALTKLNKEGKYFEVNFDSGLCDGSLFISLTVDPNSLIDGVPAYISVLNCIFSTLNLTPPHNLYAISSVMANNNGTKPIFVRIDQAREEGGLNEKFREEIIRLTQQAQQHSSDARLSLDVAKRCIDKGFDKLGIEILEGHVEYLSQKLQGATAEQRTRLMKVKAEVHASLAEKLQDGFLDLKAGADVQTAHNEKVFKHYFSRCQILRDLANASSLSDEQRKYDQFILKIAEDLAKIFYMHDLCRIPKGTSLPIKFDWEDGYDSLISNARDVRAWTKNFKAPVAAASVAAAAPQARPVEVAVLQRGGFSGLSAARAVAVEPSARPAASRVAASPAAPTPVPLAGRSEGKVRAEAERAVEGRPAAPLTHAYYAAAAASAEGSRLSDAEFAALMTTGEWNSQPGSGGRSNYTPRDDRNRGEGQP